MFFAEADLSKCFLKGEFLYAEECLDFLPLCYLFGVDFLLDTVSKIF
jgi:hypothetical protein